MMMGVVINPFFDWQGDRPPKYTYDETVIYEAHVKGLTETHPDIPEEQRGTYAGVAHPAIIEHLKGLGVTAIELMPVHQFVQDNTLLEKGLRNYWGYNTIGFFAPHQQYASATDHGQQVQEFKTMVRVLHEAGIEVILDVVYNHTAEGNHLGPTLSFKGIDNAAYYRLVEDDQQYYMDYTGTGNSLNVRHPHSLQLIMDSLRYWVTEMHVDGFRFDLAAALAREFYEVDRLSTFFELVQQDPDRQPGQAHRRAVGRRAGRLPGRQLPARSGRSGTASTATPCATSGAASRRPSASSPRGSPDRPTSTSATADGPSRRSTSSPRTTASPCATSCRTTRSTTRPTARTATTARATTAPGTPGVEGPTTDDGDHRPARASGVKNFLATLLLSQGVPMICSTATSWAARRTATTTPTRKTARSPGSTGRTPTPSSIEFTTRVIELRRKHPTFRRQQLLRRTQRAARRGRPSARHRLADARGRRR